MKSQPILWLLSAIAVILHYFAPGTIRGDDSAAVLDIGLRRELFVDGTLITKFAGKAELRLHHPVPQEVVLDCDRPWEGNAVNYNTVFQDGDRYRMYYRGSHGNYVPYVPDNRPNHPDVYCYAESSDGIRWTRPNLGLVEFNGSKENNIILKGVGAHAFSPFKDSRPDCQPDAKYKALGVGYAKKHGLYAFQSPDGIRWTLISPEPVITEGAFDSQNLAFWDGKRGEYRAYSRHFRNGRDIQTCTSKDFIKWSTPQFVDYDSWDKSAAKSDDLEANSRPGRVSQFYTNQIMPYHRAPHLLLGFPTRYIDRGWSASARALPRYDYRLRRGLTSRREGTAITDGMLIASRDGQRFRVWADSFLRPGLRSRASWFYGDAYQAWGLVETKSAFEDGPLELSLYATERNHQEVGGTVLRRYTIRMDGFVSLRAPLAGGEATTKPLRFAGSQLRINFASSAAGDVRVEIQDESGRPIPGYSMNQCDDIYGDDLDRTVTWNGSADVRQLAGQTVRLRLALEDADVFSFRFLE